MSLGLARATALTRRCEVTGVLGRVGAAVIGEPLERMGRAQGGEPCLDSFQHHVTDHAAADAGARDCMPGDDLAVMGIDDEGETNDLAVPATTAAAPPSVIKRRQRYSRLGGRQTGY